MIIGIPTPFGEQQLARSTAFPTITPQNSIRTEMQGDLRSSYRVPLRVGLLLDSVDQPLWVHELVHSLKNSLVVRVVTVFVGTALRHGNAPGENGWHHLAYRIYCRFDKWKFLEQPDVTQRSDITGLIHPWPAQDIQIVHGRNGANFTDEARQQILEQQLDVLLFAGETNCWGEIPRLARYGMWAYRFGTSQPPAFWEVVERIPVVPSGLYICADQDSAEQHIYGSVAPADKRSPSRASNHIYIKTGQFAVRKLEQLYRMGRKALDSRLCQHPDPFPVPCKSGVPDNFDMARAFSRIMTGFIRDVYRHKVDKEVRWDLAFRFGGERLDPAELYLISPPKGGFWADPFPWQYGGRYYIFFEELLYADRKGRLRVVEVQRDGSWSEPLTVLEKDYHLSYPFLFEWQGELYMLPETVANRTIELYRCVSFPNQWELCKVLMEDVIAVDATLLQRNGKWWMFVSMGLDPEGGWDEVSLFHADTPLGPWHSHPCNPIRSDVRAARPAGWLFEREGRLYRPAQDCSERYGYALSINEVRQMDISSYEEVVVKRILPRPELGELGIHTVNQAGDLIVFDRYAPEAKSGRLS